MRHSRILAEFISDENIKIFAEVGVQFGVNLSKILRSASREIIKEYWAIDCWGIEFPQLPSGSWIETVDDFRDLYKGVCQFMCSFKQLRVIKLLSVEASRLFPDEYFDMVYIDAEHSFDAVTQDIKAWLPKVKIGGILGGHDYNIRRVRKAVEKQLVGVWKSEEDRRVWFKRRQETDIVERQSIFKPLTKSDLVAKNRKLVQESEKSTIL